MAPRVRQWTVIALAVVALDQLTKLWARAALPTDPRGFGVPVPVIDGYFDLRLAFNPGSAFGLFADAPGARTALTLVALGAIAAIGWMVRHARDDQRALIVALALLAGGAIGNVLDRLALGRVTDFIVWKFPFPEWPVFNVADLALCAGVGVLIFDMVREAAGARRRRTSASPSR